MRAVKIAGIVIGSLVGVVIVALVAVWLFVDPNDYKDRIAASVKDSTGRELSLPGELKLSVFPWIAIETGEAALGNPAGFGDEPFLTLQRARLSVKLLPLLRKQLEVGRIELDGLDLRLKQDSTGKGNWEDWGGSETAEEATTGSGSGPQGLTLAGVGITGSRIAFEDMVAEQVEVKIGRIAPGQSFPVELQMQLVTAPGETPMPFAARFALLPDLDSQRYAMEEVALSGSVQPAGAPKALEWLFDSPAIDLDLAAQKLAPTEFKAALGDAELDGQIEGESLVDAPVLSGRFRLQELAPRELMQQLGSEAPVTRDPDALERFAAEGNFSWKDGVARLTGLALSLDESKLTGRFAYDTGNSGMDFALDLDRIDLDRYQPPPTGPEVAAEPIELPVDLLRPMRAKGTFNVGEIKVGGAQLTQLSAAIAIADAVARFGPMQAQLYGGRYSGNIGLDMRPEVPRLTMDEHMSGIDIAKLMKEYADSELLSGKGNLDVKLAATGSSGDALVKTLTGTIGINLKDGAVEGIDVWHAIEQAQSLVKNRQLAEVENRKRTAFDTFQASADVLDGVATTNDLVIASQLLRITGTGSTDLAAGTLDYTVKTTILKTPPGAADDTTELVRASIPVKITGSLDDPKVRPDLAGMAKEQLKQEVEKRREEVEEKVKDKARDVLRGLFDR